MPPQPVVVVGAGPVGLTLAIDLAQHDVPVLLLDDGERGASGSRAICFAKRTLEIFDRLGCGDRMVAKGVAWNVGRVFAGDAQVYQFNLLPQAGHERPAFINLQQYHVEAYLAERAAELPAIDLRRRHRVTAIEQREAGVRLDVDTPQGRWSVDAAHVVACDGSHSTLRQLLGLESQGRRFRDRFLIVDVRIAPGAAHGLPAERWFWFDPPFHPGQSVLLHRQPDDLWRIDFQLGWQADPEQAMKPENILPRVRALLGPDIEFQVEWASVYTFACQRLPSFRSGRVLFAGDAAHGVSPFGARGANSGVQDADNLAWKLACVLRGQASSALLDSYASEREAAADENIRHATRATDFISPKSEISRLFRDATLDLARTHPFARALVNSGRLSVPATLRDSPLNTPDTDPFAGDMVPGAPAADAPVVTAQGPGWLLRHLRGHFTALVFGAPQARLPADARLQVLHLAATPTPGALLDAEGLAAQRYDARPGSVVLLRPDQHVCARWRQAQPQAVRAALERALP